MKKKTRRITVNSKEFVYWHKAFYNEKRELSYTQLMVSPKAEKNVRLLITFSLEQMDDIVRPGNLMDLGTVTNVSLKDEKGEPSKMPLIYYDTEMLFSAVGRKEGETIEIDWGKPSGVKILIEYILNANKWIIEKGKVLEYDGWKLLKEIGYTELKPVISWGW